MHVETLKRIIDTLESNMHFGKPFCHLAFKATETRFNPAKACL